MKNLRIQRDQQRRLKARKHLDLLNPMADSIKDLEILALVPLLQQEQVTIWIEFDLSYKRHTS